MKCKKCGNDDLAFVSITVQDGKDDKLFELIGAINILIFILGVIAMFIAIADFIKSSKWDISEYFVFIGVATFLVIIPGTIFFLCSSFRKLMPYKTHDEIKCVCRHCGHTETVKEESQATSKPIEQIHNNNFYY